MKHKIIVVINRYDIGVEHLPDDVEVEVRLYGDEALESHGAEQCRQDERGEWYVPYHFRGV